ncbi:MAG: ferrous iron transport protein B [Saprospirales bacterium]|nr:ferrous iron transport protein B [Saprospirales bacterium]
MKVALLGNPNSGKTSVFNKLTGLRQKVGNFPGVTVDIKTGKLQMGKSLDVDLIDLPGTYSLFPHSKDERIVVNTLCNPGDENFPDAIVYVANSAQLEKHLLLFTQLLDLNIPIVLALNMADVAEGKGMKIDNARLSKEFQTPVLSVNARTGDGIDRLKVVLEEMLFHGVQAGGFKGFRSFYALSAEEESMAEVAGETTGVKNLYQGLLIAHHHSWLTFLEEWTRETLHGALENRNFPLLHYQVRETMDRFDKLGLMLKLSALLPKDQPLSRTEFADGILTHRFWGPIIFFVLMFLVFQAIFIGASYPMDWIEQLFSGLGHWVQTTLPDSWFVDLLVKGILAGLGGILVFIPQIAILFFLISILEEVGYMARAVFLFDNLMSRFGLNGRSIVALISGGACAVPAIMSTRTISNWKERLITIMVTPLISCSARIPVYALLIGFAIPSIPVLGIFNLQGIAFMGLYLLGITAALGAALVFKLILRSGERSFLLMELPDYKPPQLRNIGYAVYEKVKTFTLEAGKIILAISIVLWVLADFGPGKKMAQAEAEARVVAVQNQLDEAATADLIAAHQIEVSYAGYLGKFIEPVIRPLGFDWKIGIALITSFAAREVFVGTMATIYSIGSESDEFAIRDRLAQEKNPVTGKPVYNMATALSLLIFYVFAMQCMSTIAVVRRETHSWKWPIIQFVFMSGLAYLGSLLTFQVVSAF